MKTLIILTLFITLSFYAKAQSWCPVGATWHYALPGPGDGYCKYTYLYDTIVGSDVCQKIKWESHGHGMGGFVIDVSGYTYTKFQNGIVFKNNGTLASPQYDTLYYFNGSVGAKWRCQPNSGASCAQSYIEIIDTGNVVIQGQSLKWRKIFYKNEFIYPTGWTQSGNDTIFERIGTRHDMEFISGGYCADVTDVSPLSFRCYSDFQMNLQGSTVACDFTTGIKENGSLQDLIQIENPANETLTGIFPHDNYDLKLMDATGKLVYSDHFEKKDFSINVSDLPNGIYLVQITTAKGVLNKKVLIQH